MKKFKVTIRMNDAGSFILILKQEELNILSQNLSSDIQFLYFTERYDSTLEKIEGEIFINKSHVLFIKVEEPSGKNWS